MKKNTIIYFAVLVLTFNSAGNNYGQIGDWVKKAKDAIEKKKQPKTEEQQKSEPENTNDSSASNSARKNILQVKPSTVGKIYFSNQPFGATNQNAKTSFTTGEYIYGRFETGGKTLREAFGFAPISKENPEHRLNFNLYLLSPDQYARNGYREILESNNTVYVILSEADLDKTYLNFDVLPEPSKRTTIVYGAMFPEYRVEEENSGSLRLYKFLKSRAEEMTYTVKIELLRKTVDFRGEVEPEEKWRTVEGAASFEFKSSHFAKIKSDQEKMEADRLARITKNHEASKKAALENEPLPKEWTLKSNPLLPGLTESNLRALFQKYGDNAAKQIVKFYADPAGSTARQVTYNELGIPKYRKFDQWFTVFVKEKFSSGEEVCFYQNFRAAQEYAGGGTYGNLILVRDNRVDISCAKLGVK